MDRDKLTKLYKKYDLSKDDVFNHKHYLIITRQGIDKIQAVEKLSISYEVIKCDPEFAAVKAIAEKDGNKIETFGSAKYGGKEWLQFSEPKNGKTGKWDEKGSTTSWYVLEMAEKRAMSRAVLKLTGFYELGAFGEDESEDFKKGNEPKEQPKKESELITDFEKAKQLVMNCNTDEEAVTLWYGTSPELHSNEEYVKVFTNKRKSIKEAKNAK